MKSPVSDLHWYNNLMDDTLQTQQPAVILTIDVEDWFQVENFKKCISYDSWETRERRVEKNTHLFMDILDSIETFGAVKPQFPKATFFILGWIAERFPGLVREIVRRGHEVASHGYMHHLCSTLDSHSLKQDIIKSKLLIEDITGHEVIGYRAPSFNIDPDIVNVIQSCGFLYDSSYNSYGGHSRYGHIDFSSYTKKGIAIQLSKTFYELPVSNLTLHGKVLPWGGGGYFRLIPIMLFNMGVKRIIQQDGVFLFYTHPWEFDPEQPRVNDAPLSFKFRHYVNLRKTHDKLVKFISKFSKLRFVSCRDYLFGLSEVRQNKNS